MTYSQEALEEMANKIDLLEYASKSVDFVKHTGHTHYCLCPFHDEKTPSLAINSDENFFYCFGCGRNGNIYKWIMWQEGMTFDQAVEKVADMTNSDLFEYMESESMAFYKLLNRLNKTEKTILINRPVLDIEKEYNKRFKDEIPQEWIEEGISVEEIKKYEIRIDPISNRIVYPVYSDNGDLISVKGRTRFKSYKDLKIMKYMFFHKIGILDYFQGMKQAKDFIKQSKEIIIFEGIKSVMKVDQWGYHNAVSAETSTINDYQVELLIRMKINNVVVAFDKDVDLKKIVERVRLLKRFMNVYVVYDKWGLLQGKDSPCDQGEEVWRTLYERRIRL